MARPRFKATPALRERVRSYSAVGVKHDDIAKMIGCSSKTLRLHFRDELVRGEIEANANIMGKLYQIAMGGSLAAIMFWYRVRAGWKESPPSPQPRPDPYVPPPSPPNPMDNILIIIPDNGRDSSTEGKITEGEFRRRYGRSPFARDSRPLPLCAPIEGNGVVEEPDEGE